MEDYKARLKNQNKKELTEDYLNQLKNFENETIQNFQNILYQQQYKTENVKDKSSLNKFESKLIHLDKRLKPAISNNLVMLNDINNLMDNETIRLEKEYVQIKAEAVQKCEQLSSKLNDSYVVHK